MCDMSTTTNLANPIRNDSAMHKKSDEQGGGIYHMIGRYDDKLVRTKAGWRIKKRELIIDFEEGEKAPDPK